MKIHLQLNLVSLYDSYAINIGSPDEMSAIRQDKGINFWNNPDSFFARSVGIRIFAALHKYYDHNIFDDSQHVGVVWKIDHNSDSAFF